MNADNEKSRTIKIDIRSLGYERTPVSNRPGPVSAADYFDALDYRFLFEQAYDGILLADATGHVMAANVRAAKFFGYEDVGISGCSIRTLIAGVTDQLLHDIQEVIAKGRYMRIQAFAVHHDETFTPVEIVVIGNRVQAPDRTCFLIRDIQRRWQSEQKLLSAYHAMDNTDSGIGIVDLNGKISYANRTMVSLLAGGNEAEVLGQKLDTWFDRKSVIEPMFANIGKRKAWSGEQRILSDVKPMWLMVSAIPDINDDQELCGGVISMRDTAERRRAESAEYQVERNRIMMESLTGVCHALGQPATVLLTSIEIMKMDEDTNKNQTLKELVDLCYDAVIQLRELLQKMNAKRMYASEPYLSSDNNSGEMVNLEAVEHGREDGA